MVSQCDKVRKAKGEEGLDVKEKNNIRFHEMPSALLCLQESLEDWVREFFEDAYFLSAHAHRMTIQPMDFNTL